MTVAWIRPLARGACCPQPWLEAPPWAGGRPEPRPAYTTNEELQAMIEAEKKSMGITAIIPPEEGPSSDDPMMAGSLQPDRLNNAAKRTSARLEGDTPAIITPRACSAPSAAGQRGLAPRSALNLGPPPRPGQGSALGRPDRSPTFLSGPAGEASSRPGRRAGQRGTSPWRRPPHLRAYSRAQQRSQGRTRTASWASHKHRPSQSPPWTSAARWWSWSPRKRTIPPATSCRSRKQASLLVRCRRRESSYAERPVAVSFRVVP